MYVLTTEVLDTTRFEIAATLVTFEQENITSPIKLSHKTIQRLTVEKGINLTDGFSSRSTVLWRDHLIGSFDKTRLRTHGLFLWNMKENSIFYFDVCHSFFPSPGTFESQFATDGFLPKLYQSL